MDQWRGKRNVLSNVLVTYAKHNCFSLKKCFATHPFLNTKCLSYITV